MLRKKRGHISHLQLDQATNETKLIIMCFAKSGPDYGAMARADEIARQARIKQGMAAINDTFNQFNSDFYDRRRDAFTATTMPQLNDQFDKSKEQLQYNLARSGLTDSSARSANEGELQRQMDVNKADVAGKAMDFANQARTQVEQNRADLVGQLNATGDAQAAAQGALSRAAIAANQPSISPIGMMFQNTTGLLGQASQAGAYDRRAPGLQAYGLPMRSISPSKERTVNS